MKATLILACLCLFLCSGIGAECPPSQCSTAQCLPSSGEPDPSLFIMGTVADDFDDGDLGGVWVDLHPDCLADHFTINTAGRLQAPLCNAWILHTDSPSGGPVVFARQRVETWDATVQPTAVVGLQFLGSGHASTWLDGSLYFNGNPANPEQLNPLFAVVEQQIHVPNTAVLLASDGSQNVDIRNGAVFAVEIVPNTPTESCQNSFTVRGWYDQGTDPWTLSPRWCCTVSPSLTFGGGRFSIRTHVAPVVDSWWAKEWRGP